MKFVASLIATSVLLLSQNAHALQMILSTREPQCLIIEPVRIGVNIDISFTISGVNETAVLFTAQQGEVEKSVIKNESSGEISFKADRKDNIEVCWQKLDRKSKKVNFLIAQQNQHLEDKATADTIEEVGSQIENLQYKLDEISMNIQSQVETEQVHFELT